MNVDFTWLASLATIAILVGYELSFAWAEHRAPERIGRSAHARMRADWFLGLSTRAGSELLAVQTLRNSLMSATMIASTSALGLIGTVTISASTLRDTVDSGAGAWRTLTPALALELVLLTVLFASLVSSVMAVRFFTHVSFIAGMPVGSAERLRWSAVGTKYVRRAGILYSWALRHLIIIAPILVSILHPPSGPVAALIIVAVLLHFDRVAAHKAPPGPAGAIVPSKD